MFSHPIFSGHPNQEAQGPGPFSPGAVEPVGMMAGERLRAQVCRVPLREGEKDRSVSMWELRSLGLSLHPCEMGWQLPLELWPNPPGGSDRLSRL